jgi:hypothetical protein
MIIPFQCGLLSFEGHRVPRQKGKRLYLSPSHRERISMRWQIISGISSILPLPFLKWEGEGDYQSHQYTLIKVVINGFCII